MARDLDQFPEDGNGDVLWRMFCDGDDLSIRREIDFAVIFPSEDSAISFAVSQLRQGFKVSFSPYEENEEMPWEVLVHPVLLPTHEEITHFEELLGQTAEPLKGRNDGWGCMQQQAVATRLPN